MIRIYFIMCCSVLLSACSLSPKKFKEGIVINNQVQYAEVVSIANSSTDAVDFASKIYVRQPEKKNVDSIVVDKFGVADKSFVDKKKYNEEDRKIFASYCNAKSGEIFLWDVESGTTSYGRLRGINKRFVTCEVNSKLESVLLYESYGRDSSLYPYESFTTIANSSFAEKLFEDNKVKGYMSSNGIITVPLTRLYNPADKIRFISDKYTVTFNFQNTTSRPVEIDLLGSYITLNGAKYYLGFDKDASGKDAISWKSYRWSNESQGGFTDENGSDMNKLRFNSGQKLRGEFSFQIPGLAKMTEYDMKSLEFHINGIICNGFKLVPYYELNKKAGLKAVTTSMPQVNN